MNNISEDNIIYIMKKLNVSRETSIKLLKKGININYIKNGLFNKINDDINNKGKILKTKINDILKTN